VVAVYGVEARVRMSLFIFPESQSGSSYLQAAQSVQSVSIHWRSFIRFWIYAPRAVREAKKAIIVSHLPADTPVYCPYVPNQEDTSSTLLFTWLLDLN
jgi:hypothetical protein